jgi:hypothetical protein
MKPAWVKFVRPKRHLFKWILALGEPAPTLDHVLLEEGTGLGPVVAIGVPGSAPPFGAARTYFDDDQWKAAVAELASEARALVIVVDDTEGVVWELSHIRNAGLTSKTLYFLPPRLTAPKEVKRIIHREVIEPLGLNVEKVCAAELGELSRPCIGWFQHSSGRLELLTTRRPSSASYAVALRAVLGREWDMAKDRLRSLSPIAIL